MPATVDAKTDRWLDQGAKTSSSSQKNKQRSEPLPGIGDLAAADEVANLVQKMQEQAARNQTAANESKKAVDAQEKAATEAATGADDAAKKAGQAVSALAAEPAQVDVTKGDAKAALEKASASAQTHGSRREAVDKAKTSVEGEETKAKAAKEAADKAAESGKAACDAIKGQATQTRQLDIRAQQGVRRAQAILQQNKVKAQAAQGAEKKRLDQQVKKDEAAVAKATTAAAAVAKAAGAIETLHDAAFAQVGTIGKKQTATGASQTAIGTQKTDVTKKATSAVTAVNEALNLEKQAQARVAKEGSTNDELTIGPVKVGKDFDLDKAFGPLQLNSVGFDFMVEGKKSVDRGGTRTSGTAVNVEGFQKSVEEKLSDKVKDGVEIKVKGAANGKWSGADIEFEATFDTGKFPPASIGFVPFGVDWTEAEVTVAELTIKLSNPPINLGEIDGYKLELKGEVFAKIGPNWGKLGQYMAEQFGKQAVTAIAIDGAIIAAGVATLMVYFNAVLNQKELANRADAAGAALKGGCAAYKAVMTGGSAAGGAGADLGAKMANIAIQRAKAPRPTVIKEAKSRSLDSEARAAIAPKVKAQAIAAYWEEHWFEKMVYGEKGAGAGGFRTFKMVLDAALK